MKFLGKKVYAFVQMGMKKFVYLFEKFPEYKTKNFKYPLDMPCTRIN